jgi:guanylate kinase
MTPLLGNRKKGLLFIVSAPAGTGKTTLVRMLAEEFSNIVASLSYTTRKPREGESHLIDYFFVEESEFKQKIEENEFLEYVQLYDSYYGTSKQWVDQQIREGKHVILVIDTQGALKLKDQIDATFIFIKPPSIEILRKRLTGRNTEPKKMVEKRLEWALVGLEASQYYDYIIVNDNLEIAYQVLKSIVVAECHRISDL